MKLVSVTSAIAERARNLRWLDEINLKGADSIHVASAMKMNCDAFWTGETKSGLGGATNKQQLAKLKLNICPPNGLLIPEKYLQEDLDLAGLDAS